MKNKITYLFIVAMFTLMYTSGYAQNKVVKGKVTDAAGLPLPGANVIIKGTQKGVSTDFDGLYAIEATTGQVLVFTFTGSKTEERTIGQSLNYDVKLTDNNTKLEEVVVVGYGTKKKKDLTGSVVSVNAEQIATRPVQNAVQAMQGKAAGVDISSNERPGSVGTITIRGVRSISASNSPLYVVDGIPISSGTVSDSNAGGIDFINPNDIESIDVLKDASATAIYGSRGANGVIIVTTKKGKSGKFTLNYDNSVVTETLHQFAPMMNASEYITFRRWAAYYNNNTLPKGNAPTIANDKNIFLATADPSAWANIEKGWANGTWDGSKVATTDWTKFVTQTGITQQHTISASGGTDKMKAYGSFGYTDNTGTLKGQGFKRYNGIVNVDITPTKWFTMGASINASYGLTEYGQSNAGKSANVSSTGIYMTSLQQLPYAVPYDSNGARIAYPGGDSAVLRSVVDEDKYSQDQRATIRAFGSFYAQFDLGSLAPILDGLKYRVNFGPDVTSYRDGVYLDANSAISANKSFASLSKSQTISYTLDHLLYYNKSLGDHSFGATLLKSQTVYSNETSSMEAFNIPNAANKWNALTPSNVTLNKYASNITESGLLSYMGRINYGYADKYLLTASGRYDAASQLATGNKWAFFPSTALAWRIDKENFMKNVSWVNQLKLRAGFGVTGNAAVSPYSTQPPLSGILYPSGAGLVNNTVLGNTSLGWEKTTQYNYGLDFSLLNSRISGSLEYYSSNTTDLLLNRSVPTITGFSSTYANVGATAGDGVELTLNTVNVQLKDFEWTSSLSASTQKSHIVSLQNGKFDDVNNNLFIGQSPNVVYGFASNGIWKPEDAAEMAKFNANGAGFTFGNARPVDQNGDYKIDANNDRVIIGTTNPKYIAGLTNTFKYKNVDFSFFIYGRFKYLYNTGGENSSAKLGQRSINYYNDDNTNADYQKPIASAGTGDQFYPTLGYADGSFLKVRNISVGYRFTDDLTQKIGLSKLRLYLQVANPTFIFSNVKWTDLDTQTLASNRGFTLGLNAQF